MAKPLVAIVGRPNVGKSTFFNKMAGHRISIVEDTPGVTRDRVYADAEWQSRRFTLIDTGGIDPTSTDPLLSQMRRQAEIAVETCDAILFFTDGKEGVTSDDQMVADMLRRSGKPCLLVVNKIDTPRAQNDIYDFYALGIGDPIGISSVNLLNLGDMLDRLCELLPEQEEEEEDDDVTKIAVVGKPNAGKSSLVNRILGEDRVMVSDIAGTTRDAIDSRFTANGKDYVIIDTAGIRRRRAIAYQSLERFSVVRALAAIDRCDVALLLVDAEQGVSEQDAKIAGYVDDQGKACVLCINKWDTIEKDSKTHDKFIKGMREQLQFMDYADVICMSALTGQRVDKVIAAAEAAAQENARRVTTGVLNDVLADAQASMQPPTMGGRRLKIYYGTQQSVKPPTFILFVNDEKLMHFAYQRYLENRIRQAFGFRGTPIRFILRERKKEDDAE